MGSFFASLAFSCIYLLITIWIMLRAGRGWASLLAFPFLLIGFGHPAIMIQCLLTAIVIVICAGARAKRGLTVGLTIGTMVFAYGFVWLGVWEQLDNIAEMQRAFPFKSMQPRLAYEDRWHLTDGTAPPAPPVFEVSARLATYEMDYRNLRGNALEELHSEYYSRFIIEAGFGQVRMSRISPLQIRLPELVVVPQPATPPATSSRHGPPGSVDPKVHPADDLLLTTHDGAYLNFLNPELMGYAESRERVSGFVPHQFSEVPPVEHDEWQVTRLELISLLKHEEPMAYLSENLPRMEELAEAEVRPLNSFEQTSVEMLRTDSDLEIEYYQDRIEMMGAVRAAESCTECHTVPRGHLLGAFSYTLHRVNAQPDESSAGE